MAHCSTSFPPSFFTDFHAESFHLGSDTTAFPPFSSGGTASERHDASLSYNLPICHHPDCSGYRNDLFKQQPRKVQLAASRSSLSQPIPNTCETSTTSVRFYVTYHGVNE
ncbi:uncharacterized protein RSE6_04145 [Rhynchosporium secalis]|uniref:Uncharacterized protein n=1 Tax=Rhynchosporium secalis TaxID=38038 RepID=A0A1E1M604_RHYSE|nr:uncharacterized protein RSE6_04145 [Rhynchosporium secalis]